MRRQIVQAARGWLKTPYAHHGRNRHGVDCVGLPIVVGRDLGLLPEGWDYNGYSLYPNGSLIPTCDQQLVRIPREQMQPGDMVVVSWGAGDAQHFGIVAQHQAYPALSIIHAEMVKHRCVVEHRLVFSFMRFIAAYQFPGVECRN